MEIIESIKYRIEVEEERADKIDEQVANALSLLNALQWASELAHDSISDLYSELKEYEG
jgi:hypothetical protein